MIQRPPLATRTDTLFPYTTLVRSALSPSLPIVRLEDAGMAEQMVEYVVYGLVRATREFAAYESLQRDALWNPLPAIRREDWPVGVMGMGTDRKSTRLNSSH